MQNSSSIHRFEQDIGLDGELPVFAYVYKQGDRPITSLHRHDVIEIGLCHFGSGIFMIEDKIIPYQAGDICVINEKEMHLARSHDGTSSEWTFIHFDAQRLMGQHQHPELSSAYLCGQHFCNILSSADYPLLDQLCHALINEIQDTHKTLRKPAIQSLVWSIMVQLQRLPNRETAAVTRHRSIESVAPALEYMSTHFAEPIQIAELAALCQVSHVHFNRLFKAACGNTAKAYLNCLRIEIACSLLSNSKQSILHISLDCGFETLSTFNRQFQKQMQCSPRDYRLGRR